MKKIVLSMMMASFLAACATDPYTGESKVSKTAWEQESALPPEPASVL